MEVLYAIILGIVQGLTEFLPMSSSGHLILLERAGIAKPDICLNLFLHLATLLAVLIVYRKQCFELIKHPFSKKTMLYAVATIPTVIIAVIFKLFLKGLLIGSYLPMCFMFTAFILGLADIIKNSKISTLNGKNAFLTGIMQGIAVLPGVSRSGSTIATLTLLGVPKKEAKDFTFMLSIPIIIGGTIVEFADNDLTFSLSPIALMLAFLFAFFCGLLSIKSTEKVIEKGKFMPFSLYLVGMSILSFCLLYK